MRPYGSVPICQRKHKGEINAQNKMTEEQWNFDYHYFPFDMTKEWSQR